MDRIWVDQWLKDPGERLGRGKWALFEPTFQFYARLEGGDDGDLQEAASEIGKHLELIVYPSVTYEWGLKIKPEVAGQIRLGGDTRSLVQIPLFYVGKPFVLGAILAHEFMHQFLSEKDMTGANTDQLEQMTDLACIALGLGKLVLNGTITESQPSTKEDQTIGYLSPQLKVYAYRQVNKNHGISDHAARANLNENAVRLLDGFP